MQHRVVGKLEDGTPAFVLLSDVFGSIYYSVACDIWVYNPVAFLKLSLLNTKTGDKYSEPCFNEVYDLIRYEISNSWHDDYLTPAEMAKLLKWM